MEPGSKKDGVVNMTRAMEALSPWLNNPRRTIIQVEALVLAAAALLLLQLIFACCKRRWHNSLVKYGLQVSTKLMNPLIIYTLGTMQSSPIKNSLYPVWACFLIMASAGTTAVQQYNFHGSSQMKYMEFAIELGRYYFYIVMILLLIKPSTWMAIDLKHTNPKHFIGFPSKSSYSVGNFLIVLFAIKTLEYWILFLLEKEYKKNRRPLIISSDQPCASDPESMKGYKFVVYDRLFITGSMSSRPITIDQIWDFCENLPDGKAFKELCLSYALYRQLLKQRYFWVALREASLLRTPDFVFQRLLQPQGDFKRAFRIIELELGFCYDFFFTKYDIYRHFLLLTLFWPSIKIIFTSIVGIDAFRKSMVLGTSNPIIEVHIADSDYIITLLVLGIALIVELVQTAFYLASNEVQVSVACSYVKRNCWAPIIGKVAGCLRKFIVPGSPRNKISQHSLIFGQQNPVGVSDKVKSAIARMLVSSYGNQTNEETSLRPNQMFRLTLKNHSQLKIMLIWHIATEYCDASDDHHHGTGTNRDDRGVAVHLSRYCAYLIESVPELLPCDEVDIRELTEQVKEEQDGCSSYDDMNNLDVTEEGDEPKKIFRRGVKLGKQLESRPDEDRWKIMEDFWADAIIYVARTHSTAKQHMQHLENGGEFVTHVWALLAHAGVLNLGRNKDQGRGVRENPSTTLPRRWRRRLI